eukprot:1260987-Prymnesium_polylepis.1
MRAQHSPSHRRHVVHELTPIGNYRLERPQVVAVFDREPLRGLGREACGACGIRRQVIGDRTDSK